MMVPWNKNKIALISNIIHNLSILSYIMFNTYMIQMKIYEDAMLFYIVIYCISGNTVTSLNH